MTLEKKGFVVQQWAYIPNLYIARLEKDAVLPKRKHTTDAGIDFYAYGDYIIKPHKNKVVRTGITAQIPVGYFLLFKPKGGSDWLIGGGVNDAGYQGELLFRVYNTKEEQLIIRHGDAIGQGILLPISIAKIAEVSLDKIHKEESERGKAGGIVVDVDDKIESE